MLVESYHSSSIRPEVWQDAQQFPANAVYDQFGGPELINMSSTQHGIKAFLSLPYFLNANDTLKDGVVLPKEADPKKHSFELL